MMIRNWHVIRAPRSTLGTTLGPKLALALCLLFAATAGQASFAPMSDSQIDGIAYRTDLLDPYNEESNGPNSMLKRLLLRLGFHPHTKPRWNDDYQADYDAYLAQTRQLLSDPQLIETFTAPDRGWFYGYAACATNTAVSAQEFGAALGADLEPGPARDLLLTIRHDYLSLCDFTDEDRQRVMQDATSALHDLPAPARPWAQYLEAIGLFYSDQPLAASAVFEGIEAPQSPWLQETARYMLVRTAKEAMQATYFDEDYPDADADIDALRASRDAATARFAAALQHHNNAYPDSRYAGTVDDLNRFLLYWRKDRDGLLAQLIAKFDSVFVPGTSASAEEQAAIYDELKRFFPVGEAASNAILLNRDASPILLVHRLIMSMRRDDAVVPAIADAVPALADAVDAARRAGSLNDYPGFDAYAALLVGAARSGDDFLAGQQMSQADYGPFLADAMALQAHALSRLNRYLDAADIWMALYRQFGLQDTLPQAAAEHVRNGSFERFAQLPEVTALLTQAADPASGEGEDEGEEAEDEDYDEWYLRPVPATTTAENLLTQGFLHFVTPQTATALYQDSGQPALLRFLAAEPLLKHALLTGDYAGYLAVMAGLLQDLPEIDRTKAYRDLMPAMETLAQHPDDPEAMVDYGYFLYAHPVFSRCWADTLSLWVTELGKCPNEDILRAGSVGPVPLDIFQAALNRFIEIGGKNPAEGRVLKIMIYCFRSYINEQGCIRDRSRDDLDKSYRRGLFQRLHRRFPVKAQEVPYWY